MGEYLTITETAQLLKVGERTVRRWISEGEIPAFKVRRALRVRRSDIDSLVKRVERKTGETLIRSRRLGALKRAQEIQERMKASHGGLTSDSAEILRQIRLEHSHAR